MSSRNKDHVKDKKTPTARTAVLRQADWLVKETLQMLCREKTFPRRMRWLIGEPIADLANKYHSCIMTANAIRVETREEFIERHKIQTLGLAYLWSLNVKMGLAQVVLDVDPNKFEPWAKLFNDADRYTKNWISSDTKRYSQRFGPLSDAEPEEDDPFEPKL